MLASKLKKYNYFIGIDVSRDKLDVAILYGKKLLYHKEIQNCNNDIQFLIDELKALPKFTLSKALFGLEQTGIYTNHLLNNLKRVKANIVLEDAVHIQSSLGKARGKYDKLDAIRIANFLYLNKEDAKLWIQRRPIIEHLSHLSTLRFRLLKVNNSLRIPLKEQVDFLDSSISLKHKELCNGSIEALKNDITNIDKTIKDTINSDERIKRLFKIITSVHAIGPVTAIQIIVTTNEFKDITDPKKFASYAGVAPFRKESGIAYTKAKVSHMANKKIKSLLHICAVSSLTGESEFKAYYRRKTGEGKPKMAVLNALRYKLIIRVFACVAQDRVYQKSYTRDSITNKINLGNLDAEVII